MGFLKAQPPFLVSCTQCSERIEELSCTRVLSLHTRADLLLKVKKPREHRVFEAGGRWLPPSGLLDVCEPAAIHEFFLFLPVSPPKATPVHVLPFLCFF